MVLFTQRLAVSYCLNICLEKDFLGKMSGTLPSGAETLLFVLLA